MNNTYHMGNHFESEKNKKASAYTALVLGLLLIVFLFVTWTLPTIPPPIQEDGIEVNLGNSDAGLGEDQPMSPESPAPAKQLAYTPPKAVATAAEDVKDVETDDNNKEDAPVIKKPVIVKPTATKIPEKEVAKTNPKPSPVVTNPTPAPPKPKAVMTGVSGNGKGGNEADDFKKGGNQGIAGGSGDQGKPGGNPNSTNYNGNGGSGNSGVIISKGLQGRKWTRLPSFEDEFNENAKVAVDIRVDAAGNVVSASYQPRGSTTSDGSMKSIAIRKANQIKFNATGEESFGTILFNFRLKN